MTSYRILTTGGNDVCSFPFSLTTPINSSSSILGYNDNNKPHLISHTITVPSTYFTFKLQQICVTGRRREVIWLRHSMRILVPSHTWGLVSEYQRKEKPLVIGENCQSICQSNLGWRCSVPISPSRDGVTDVHSYTVKGPGSCLTWRHSCLYLFWILCWGLNLGVTFPLF